MSRVLVVSFRLGESDGVSIEAAKWIDALRALGHDVTTLAGEGHADQLMPALAINATQAIDIDELAARSRNADLVVVENLVSLPLNIAARDAMYEVLDGRPALFHHHDLAWQRDQWSEDDVPRDQLQWRHVAINELSRHQLAQRGIDATTIYNHFDVTPPLGRRDDTRRAIGIDGRLALFPSRAIPRKNVASALAFASSLDATLWLLGPAEDGYDVALDELLRVTSTRYLRARRDGYDIHDAYAASDVVVVSSTWEGFGNPVLESVTHHRPLAVAPYPVLEEIRAFGFHFFDLDDTPSVAAFLDGPDEALLEHNHELVRQHFNLADLPAQISPVVASLGLT
jgi:glycosyltransferase involved in cell wall biosynthesis